MGWLYVYSFAIFVPFELTASALVVGFWNTGVSNGVWITIFLLPLVGLNLLPVRFYGEAEFFFAGIKLATIIGLLVLSFILFWGGGPNHVRLGFHYWMHPGATKTQILEGDAGRLIAAIATIIASALPFTFTPEMVVITSGELQSPRRNLPKVSLNFNWRLVVFYVGSVVGISVVCPHNAIAFGGSTGASSPWVVAIRNAGIQSLPSVINTVIIIAAWSTGNAFLYLSSRCLYSLAVEGHAPKIFTKCTAAGTPIYAVGATSLPTLLAYLNLNSAAANVFNWLLNLVNTAGFISWVCCGIIYIRFHQARKEQRRHAIYHENHLEGDIGVGYGCLLCHTHSSKRIYYFLPIEVVHSGLLVGLHWSAYFLRCVPRPSLHLPPGSMDHSVEGGEATGKWC